MSTLRFLSLLGPALCLLTTAASLGGCGDSAGDAADVGGGDGSGGSAPKTFLDGDPSAELPELLSDVGLYAEPGDYGAVHARAVEFEPQYPLWSNGSTKQRFVVVPRGASVDNSGSAWEFPVGTLFFKTFFYPDDAGEARPVETRVLRRTAAGYDFAAYLWDDAAEDATLLDGKSSVKVAVELDGDEFEHEVPSRLQCRSCHESQEPQVLGFDELGLGAPLAGREATQLVELAEAGILSHEVEQPDRIEHGDAAEVLGYFEGNCVHCHNGGDGPAAAFDLRHDVALENLIGVETTSELAGGLRVAPGQAGESALYLMLSRNTEVTIAQPMPPLGVQRVDSTAVELVRTWIDSLPE